MIKNRATWAAVTSTPSSLSPGSSSLPMFSSCRSFSLTFWSLRLAWPMSVSKILAHASSIKRNRSSISWCSRSSSRMALKTRSSLSSSFHQRQRRALRTNLLMSSSSWRIKSLTSWIKWSSRWFQARTRSLNSSMPTLSACMNLTSGSTRPSSRSRRSTRPRWPNTMAAMPTMPSMVDLPLPEFDSISLIWTQLYCHRI